MSNKRKDSRKFSSKVEHEDVSEVVEFGKQFISDYFEEENASLGDPSMLEVVIKNIFQVGEEHGIDLLEIGLATGASLSGVGLVLHRIKNKIDQLQKDVETLLKEPMKAAVDSLTKGHNYMKNGVYKRAYDEFFKVLNESSRGYRLAKTIEDKVLCMQMSIFSRLIVDTFDFETESFVSLSEVPEPMYNTITDNILHDLDQLIEEFEKVQIPFWKRLLGQSQTEQSRNQDTIDPLLKTCLPMIWHRFDVFRGHHGNQKLLKYIPEGRNDAALLRFEGRTTISVWKEFDPTNQTYCLKWDDKVKFMEYERDSCMRLFVGFQKPPLRRFPSLTAETYFPLRDGLLEEACNPFRQEIEDSFNITFSRINGTIKANYNGEFDEKSQREIVEWINLPNWIKLECTDTSRNTLAHTVCKKGMVDLIQDFLTTENSLSQNKFSSTPLHRAVKSYDIKCIKRAIECGGLVRLQDHLYRYPWDFAKDDETIQKYFSSILLQ